MLDLPQFRMNSRRRKSNKTAIKEKLLPFLLALDLMSMESWNWIFREGIIGPVSI